MSAAHDKRLVVTDLAMRIRSATVLDGASLTIAPGEVVGLVGESGSGKSMLCRSLVGTQNRFQGELTRGSITWGGRQLVGLPEHEWRGIRGRQIGFVPQSSMAGLNPTMTIRKQLLKLIGVARPALTRKRALEAAADMLDEVRIVNPTRVLRLRPNELSGGMRQRVMIAGALAHEPDLLIADEPTTALDVTVQAQILELLQELGRQRAMSILLVSHDLSVVSEICDSVTVMYAARTVESGPIAQVIGAPEHDYTRKLIGSTLGMHRPTTKVAAPESASAEPAPGPGPGPELELPGGRRR